VYWAFCGLSGMKILAIDNWSSGALELLALLQKFDEELSKKME